MQNLNLAFFNTVANTIADAKEKNIEIYGTFTHTTKHPHTRHWYTLRRNVPDSSLNSFALLGDQLQDFAATGDSGGMVTRVSVSAKRDGVELSATVVRTDCNDGFLEEAIVAATPNGRDFLNEWATPAKK